MSLYCLKCHMEDGERYFVPTSEGEGAATYFDSEGFQYRLATGERMSGQWSYPDQEEDETFFDILEEQELGKMMRCVITDGLCQIHAPSAHAKWLADLAALQTTLPGT